MQSISGVIVTGVDLILLLSINLLLLAGILTGLVMAKFEMPVKARRSAIKFSERASVMQRFGLPSISSHDNKSWLRKDGELYLAVKVVDQEVNRLDRVRFFHLFHILALNSVCNASCVGEHRGLAGGSSDNY